MCQWQGKNHESFFEIHGSSTNMDFGSQLPQKYNIIWGKTESMNITELFQVHVIKCNYF